MNAAYVHLAVNHVPVLGVIFALALLGAAVLRRNDTLLHAGWVTVLVAAVLAFPVYFSGKDAEDIVKHRPGVTHDAIEEHEEIALVALVAIEALGLLALAGHVLSRRGAPPSRVRMGSLALAVAVAALMGVTAYRGGMINHPEAHEGAAATGGGESDRDDHGDRGRH
jgi:uncharacterized membrane protein